jgi:hypothetical protein
MFVCLANIKAIDLQSLLDMSVNVSFAMRCKIMCSEGVMLLVRS